MRALTVSSRWQPKEGEWGRCFACCEHRKAQYVISVHPNFGLFHPKQHPRIFSNVTNIPFPIHTPISATSSLPDVQIHQLLEKPDEGRILYEELSGRRYWDFLKLHPFAQDHQQPVITPMVSARVPFLEVKFYHVIQARGPSTCLQSTAEWFITYP